MNELGGGFEGDAGAVPKANATGKWLSLVVLAALPSCAKDDEPVEIAAAQIGECQYSRVSLESSAGAARAELRDAMTLPVPASITVRGGTAKAATLTYELSAVPGSEVNCSYERRSRSELALVRCERELDSRSWVESARVRLSLSDRNTQATLSLCPVGPVAPEAALDAGAEEQGVETADIPATPLQYKRIPGALTYQDVRRYAQSARTNDRVAKLLGQRSAFVQHLPGVDPNDEKMEEADPHRMRLVFFSHTHSRAVEVVVDRTTVESAEYVELWPTEGKEEVDAAIALAIRDPRLAGRVNDLEAGGMLWQPTGAVPHMNHRVMDIRFIGREDRVARYFATVDLTDETVIDAGPVR